MWSPCLAIFQSEDWERAERELTEELEVLTLVARRLESAGIAYMVSGSMAMNYYAQPRMTRDIDIVVELGQSDVERVVKMFSTDFYVDADAIRVAIERRDMFNVIHLAYMLKVDFIVRKDALYRQTEFDRRCRVSVEGMSLWTVTAEDLLLSKLHWATDSHSEMQRKDARNLVASIPTLDWEYLKKWAAELGVDDLLQEARE